jgi:2-C-methyl-D-erythritol 4-phosphate cytidylyltransferase
VSLGVAAVDPSLDVVLVHDAARPLVPADVVDRVVAAVASGASAVVPVLPMTDTIRATDADGVLAGIVDRSTLRAVQTPQGFPRSVLSEAHERFRADAADDASAATDDAVLVERLGHVVVAVHGAAEAFKVTRPMDLVLAEAVLEDRRSGGVRNDG